MISLVLAFLMVNGMALLIGSQEYQAWTIGMRNRMYYAVLRRDVYRLKAERADELAESLVRWLRPVLLVIANLVWLLCLWQTVHGN